MQTLKNAQLAAAAATPAGFGWAGIAAEAKSCFDVFARFGMGFSPELIAFQTGDSPITSYKKSGRETHIPGSFVQFPGDNQHE